MQVEENHALSVKFWGFASCTILVVISSDKKVCLSLNFGHGLHIYETSTKGKSQRNAVGLDLEMHASLLIPVC